MSQISQAMSEYRDLERRLIALRGKFEGKYSPEEPTITDRMVDVWENLSVEEQDQIYSEGAKVPRPMDGPSPIPVRSAQSPSGWVVINLAHWSALAGDHFAKQVVSRGLERWFDPISRDTLNVQEVESCT